MDLGSSSPLTSATRRRIDAARSFSLNKPDKCEDCDIFIGEEHVYYCIECGKKCCESCGDFDGMRAYTWSCYNCLADGCDSCGGYDNLQKDEGNPDNKYCDHCWEEWEKKDGGEDKKERKERKERKNFHIGKMFDVLDTSDRWSEAVVISQKTSLGPPAAVQTVLGRQVLFQYVFWADVWNEWIDIESERIAEFGTKTYQPGEGVFDVGGGTLQVGQRIEARETESGSWSMAYVEEINDEATDGKVIKVHYHARESEEDEWLPRDSDHIRQYGLKKNIYLERQANGSLISGNVVPL